MSDEQERNSETMQLITQLLEAREYRKVVELCETIQLEERLPRKFWYTKARALDALGEKERASSAYRCEIAAVRRVPPDFLGRVGVLLKEVGKNVEGAVCLWASCEIDPSTDRLILLAYCLLGLGRREQARESLRRALQIDPLSDEAWHNLGASYYIDGDPAEAERAFLRALEIDPDRADSYGGLGMAYLDQDRMAEAIEAAQKGLIRRPLNGLCHQVIGEGMERLANMEGAARAYSSAFRCDYDKSAALMGFSRILEQQGRLADALKELQKGVRAWPDDARVRRAYLSFSEKHGLGDQETTDFCKKCQQMAESLARM